MSLSREEIIRMAQEAGIPFVGFNNLQKVERALNAAYTAGAAAEREPVRYVPMTKDDALDLLGRCENETEEQVFAVVRDVESEVIRRAIAQGAKLEVQE